MSSGVSFANSTPVSDMIYLAISWGDLEDQNSLETSIILTSKPPENETKPDEGLEYYHEWKAVNTTTTAAAAAAAAAALSATTADWDLHTEAGWLGQKPKLALMLELGRIGHTDAYPLLDTIICSVPDAEPDDDDGMDCRSFAEAFMMSMATLADNPENQVTISETGKQTLREQAAEAISFAEVIVKDNRIANEPDWETHFMVMKIASEAESFSGDCDQL